MLQITVAVGEYVMKNASIYREIFINNTIHLVAEGGFERATTRAIAGERREIDNVRINEAHIYRIFGTKEKLFAEIFTMLDEELLSVINNGFVIFDSDDPFREQCWELYQSLWKFLLVNEKKCRYYTRYYFSSYFNHYSSSEHMERFKAFVERISPRFVENADVISLLRHAISTLLNFSTMVYNGELVNNDDSEYHIFNVLYCSLASYIKQGM